MLHYNLGLVHDRKWMSVLPTSLKCYGHWFPHHFHATLQPGIGAWSQVNVCFAHFVKVLRPLISPSLPCYTTTLGLVHDRKWMSVLQTSLKCYGHWFPHHFHATLQPGIGAWSQVNVCFAHFVKVLRPLMSPSLPCYTTTWDWCMIASECLFCPLR